MSLESETTTTVTDDLSAPARRWLAEVGAPEWIKRELHALRRETAGHRRRRNMAEAEAGELRDDSTRLAEDMVELGQQVEELKAALRDAEGRAHGVPEEVLARITGQDPSSIAADAAWWAEALGAGGR